MGSNIITTVTDAFGGTLEGTGSGIVGFFDTLFKGADGEITTIAVVGLSMLGLGLGTWIMKKLLNRV